MTTDTQYLPVEVDLTDSPENQQLFPDPPRVSWEEFLRVDSESFLDVDMLDDDLNIE